HGAQKQAAKPGRVSTCNGDQRIQREENCKTQRCYCRQCCERRPRRKLHLFNPVRRSQQQLCWPKPDQKSVPPRTAALLMSCVLQVSSGAKHKPFFVSRKLIHFFCEQACE